MFFRIAVLLIVAQFAIVAFLIRAELVQYSEGTFTVAFGQYDGALRAIGRIVFSSPFVLLSCILLVALLGSALNSMVLAWAARLNRRYANTKSTLWRFANFLKSTLALFVSIAVGLILHVAMIMLAGIAIFYFAGKHVDEFALIVFNFYLPLAISGSLLGLSKGIIFPRLVALLSTALLFAIFVGIAWYIGDLSSVIEPAFFYCLPGILFAFVGCVVAQNATRAASNNDPPEPQKQESPT